MTTSTFTIRKRDEIELQIQSLLESLGEGRVDGVAYDTAWTARLALRYPSYGFDQSLEWLRRHQYPDGTWGGSLIHYHDRYISTLAAIVALQEALKEGGGHPRDARRVKRGEDALWKLVGKLGRDDSDTVGFPILSTSLSEEAARLGLDVPQAPVRYASAYKKKVEALLNQPQRDWRNTTLIFSLEALRSGLRANDIVLEKNNSVAVSPSATCGYLLDNSHRASLEYLTAAIAKNSLGGTPALAPIDIFETAWSIYHLAMVGAINRHHPDVIRVLDQLWNNWSKDFGVATASHFPVTDIDDTAAAFIVLTWAGYPVSADVFLYYELEDHFCCYHGETNPSLSAHVRLLKALELCKDHPSYSRWVEKSVAFLQRLDENGSFWWDKWHCSPYYVNSTAISTLYPLDRVLSHSRLKWIIRTQNDDGGWGYYGESTSEETAYCLNALLWWNQNVGHIESSKLDSAANFLKFRINDNEFAPLWIGKSLYTPHFPVMSAILSTLYSYLSGG